MNILLLNAGSSSLKAAVMESADGSVVAHGLADWAGSATRYQFAGPDGKERSEQVPWKGHARAVERFVEDIRRVKDEGGRMEDEGSGSSSIPPPSSLLRRPSFEIAAVGHRVVHGGQFTSSVRITAEIRSRITALAELAPLHNPPSLETLAAAETALSDVPQVAVFDTAFHATLPPEAFTYPVPGSWTRDWRIRRYGFHGLSHAYCSQRAAELLARPPEELRLVVCHLGHGCSASAVLGGKCMDTTMGFTPLDGLMMATRCGSIDPSIVLHVQEHHGLTTAHVETALNRESGILGVSGLSADMRQILKASHEGHEQSRLALGIYTHRVRQAIGALAVTMGGVDALVFTAGVGENAAEVRQTICAGLQCLGLELDANANATCRPDADIASANSRGRIFVIATREDVTMLKDVLQVIGAN